jgi:hypothetical protein
MTDQVVFASPVDRKPPKSGNSAAGYFWEEYVIERLNSLGYCAQGQSYRSCFDILVNGQIRIDVKAAIKKSTPGSKRNKSPTYSFHTDKNKRSDCDFYILVVAENKDLFIIPSVELPNSISVVVFCWPTMRPTLAHWQNYHNRFDLLD